MASEINFHEDLKREAEVRGGSDRNLGLVFAAVLTLVALAPLAQGGRARWWALGLGALFLLAAVVRPAVLGPLNRFWTRLGLMLGRIVNPVVTGVLFYLVFTPAGLVARLLGKDPLRMKAAPEAATYWIPRLPPGPRPETMTKQF